MNILQMNWDVFFSVVIYVTIPILIALLALYFDVSNAIAKIFLFLATVMILLWFLPLKC